jgi:integrase
VFLQGSGEPGVSISFPSENELQQLSKDKLCRLSKMVTKVRKQKFARRKVPKYRFPGFKAMPLDEVDRFFSAFRPEEYRFKVLFLAQAFLGLRVGEVVQLNVKDIDFRNKQIRIKTEKQGYFEVVDSMFLHEKLEGLLLDYLAIYEKDILAREGFLFFSNYGQCETPFVSTDSARKVFRRVCNRAGLDAFYGYREKISKVGQLTPGRLFKYTTHSLRHAFAKFLVKRHIPIEIAKHLLRHQDLRSTQVYFVPDKEDVDAVSRQLFAVQQKNI